MKFPGWLACILLTTGPFVHAAAPEPDVDAKDLPRVPAVPPEDALKTFQVKPGFKLELVAAEPLVVDPIALSFDEQGRMYVVEMRDYSERRDEHLGRIRLLEDTDGDGRFDKSTVFAEDLAWPTAVICYDGGVFVAATPDIIYLKDTTGDGKADVRETVFTGFGEGTPRLNVQQLVNSFAWGLDNRIYGANGGNGGSIRSVTRPQDKPLELRGRDFSFDPRNRTIRGESGGGQYGLSFNSEGRKFVCSNSSHIRAIMYDDRYAAANKLMALPPPAADIAGDGPAAEVYRISPEEPWRVLRTKWRVAGLVPGPIEGGGRASGYFTSATGITIYRGDAFPKEYQGNAFIADCGSNLIHRKRVLADGPGYKAERAADEARVEFLASRDLWFRPVQMANAPDGALYVIDMYREVIEHPWSFPASIKKHLDLNSGNDRGRIYRVVPTTFQQRPAPGLQGASTERLVETLAHPNGWHRDTAARLLWGRQDQAAVPALRALFLSAQSPVARMHVLYALHGLGALGEKDLRAALHDPEPLVRQHGLRLLEELPRVGQDRIASGDDEFRRLSRDPDARVRYQFALTLGMIAPGDVVSLLDPIVRRDGGDPWMRMAALNAAGDHAAELAMGLLDDGAFIEREDAQPFLNQVLTLVGARNQRGEVDGVLSRLRKVTTPQIACSLGRALGEGTRRAGSTLFRASDSAQSQPLFRQALDLLQTSSTPEPTRVDAIQLLSHNEFGAVREPIRAALAADQSAAVQKAAIEALASFGQKEIATDLLDAWDGLTPALRIQVVEALLRRPERLDPLLSAVESGKLRPSDLTAAQVDALRKHANGGIGERASKVLGQAPSGARAEVVKKFEPALSLDANAGHGREIYLQRCSSCHRLAGEGYALGPDLESIRANGKQALLANLIDPNREVMPKYVNYLAETRAGDSWTGLVAVENDSTVVLRQPNGNEVTLLRSGLATFRSLGQSVMPEGLEEGLSPNDLADLMGYVLSAGGR